MKGKKLYIVVNVDWFFLSHRLPVALAAQKAGWDVTIVTADTGKLKDIEAVGLKTINLPMSRSGMNIMEELKTLKFLRDLYRGEKPDVVQHKDDKIRYQSTSGGGFTAIAEEVIRRGGVVFGAIMTDELKVRHDYVSDTEGLARFRNSKYVQSEIGDCYRRTRDILKEGKLVCFSGTPCQINGLYKYLGKDYDNLIAVDVVCKSVPSPMIFQKYVEYKREREGNISDIVFRDKKRGFLYCTMAHYLTHIDRKVGKSVYRRGSESDEWLRLFLSGKISRHSCVTCPYQTKQRVGDFTLGDIWETNNPEFDDNRGSTLLHVWTKKGAEFLESIKPNIRWMDYEIEKSRGTEREHSLKIHPGRAQLFKDAQEQSSSQFFARYAPNSLKIKAKQTGRYLLWKLSLQNVVRHLKHMVIHR